MDELTRLNVYSIIKKEKLELFLDRRDECPFDEAIHINILTCARLPLFLPKQPTTKRKRKEYGVRSTFIGDTRPRYQFA